MAALIELMATNVAEGMEEDSESLLVMMAAVAVVGLLLWRTCVFTLFVNLLTIIKYYEPGLAPLNRGSQSYQPRSHVTQRLHAAAEGLLEGCLDLCTYVGIGNQNGAAASFSENLHILPLQSLHNFKAAQDHDGATVLIMNSVEED